VFDFYREMIVERNRSSETPLTILWPNSDDSPEAGRQLSVDLVWT